MSTDYFDDIDLVTPSSPVPEATTSEMQTALPVDSAAAVNEPAQPQRRARRTAVPLGDLSRLPPHSIEAEQGVLGCLFLDPVEMVDRARSSLKAGAETFYDLRHRKIYGEIVAMADAGEAVDLITVQQRLRNNQQLEAVGGLAYLSSLMDGVPSASNLDYYLEILREKHLLRRMLQVSAGVIARVHENEGNVDGLLNEVERDFQQIGVERDTGTKLVTIGEHLQETLTRYSSIVAGTVVPGIYHGFLSARSILPILRYGEEYLIAGRPSSGKTSLALSIALNVSQLVPSGEQVAFMSLETPVQGIIDRAIGNLGGVEPRRVDIFSEADHRSLAVAAGRLRRLPLIIEYGPWGLKELLARMTELMRNHGVRTFVIDYVGLIEATNRRAMYRDQVSEIAKAIKRFAKTNGVVMILLAQLSRETEKENRRPRMSDLGESSVLENEADVVWLIGKPKSELFEVPVLKMETFIDKHRDGRTGRVQLLFEKTFFRYSDVPEEMLAEDSKHT